jgi:hypothetical protein
MKREMNEAMSVASDLRWYFVRSEAGPLRSNYAVMAHRLELGQKRGGSPATWEQEEFLEGAARAGAISRVLRGLEPETVEVLWRLFGAERTEEVAALGENWPVAPLTRAAREGHAASGSSKSVESWVEALLTRAYEPEAFATVQQIHHDARELRRGAIAAYLGARRRMGCHA